MSLKLEDKIVKESNEFITDVCAGFVCKNQDDEYMKEYLNWRRDKNNPYGYNFVKDQRENTYVGGIGFIDEKPEYAEKSTLRKCSVLLGLSLFTAFIIEFVFYIILPDRFNSIEFCRDKFFEACTCNNEDMGFALFYGISEVLKYLIPLLVFNFFAKVPKKVMIPKRVSNKALFLASIPIILLVIVISRYFNSLLYKLFGIVNVSVSHSEFIYSSDLKVMIVNALIKIIIVSIISEILLHGAIMQTLRQFGDRFALIAVSIIAAFLSNDFTSFVYYFMISLVIGHFVLRTGSVYTGILMKIISGVFVFSLHLLMIYVPETESIKIHTVISLLTIALGIIVIVRLHFKKQLDLSLYRGKTSLTNRDKLHILFFDLAMISWLVPALMISILTIRFVN